MKALLHLAIPLALVSSTTAQQAFQIGGTQSFVSRGSIGRGAGEILQGVHASHHRGVAEAGSRCAIDAGFRIVLQDQNSATRETYSIVVRDGTDARGPGASFTGIGPFQTPPGGGGVAAWRVTHTLSRPIPLPCNAFFAFGIRVPAAPGWTRDGVSTRVSLRDRCAHARLGDHAWDVSASGAVRHPPGNLAWGYELLVRNASLLQLGNGAGGYGMGGLFPRAGCPLTVRTRFPASLNGGTSRLYVALGRTPGVSIVPGSAKVYLGGALLLVGSATIARGEATHTLATSVPAVPAGAFVHAQALGVRGTTVAVTSSQSAQF